MVLYSHSWGRAHTSTCFATEIHPCFLNWNIKKKKPSQLSLFSFLKLHESLTCSDIHKSSPDGSVKWIQTSSVNKWTHTYKKVIIGRLRGKARQGTKQPQDKTGVMWGGRRAQGRESLFPYRVGIGIGWKGRGSRVGRKVDIEGPGIWGVKDYGGLVTIFCGHYWGWKCGNRQEFRKISYFS